jgi:putative phosphoesterase
VSKTTKPIERVGVVGDIHGQSARLAALLELYERESVDAVLSVGDIADGPGDIELCCQLLRQANATVVKGNHDRWLLEDRLRGLPDSHLLEETSNEVIAFLHSLPTVAEMETATGRLQLCHGLGTNDMVRLKPEDEGYALQSNTELESLMAREDLRYVIGGHTHQPMVRHFEELTVINAGALYRSETPCGVIVDFLRCAAHFYDVAELPPSPAERHDWS